jgi:hypothetical protein
MSDGHNGRNRNTSEPKSFYLFDDEDEEEFEDEESSQLMADYAGEKKAITAVINIYKESEDENDVATAKLLSSMRRCGLAVQHAKRVVRRVLAEQAIEDATEENS